MTPGAGRQHLRELTADIEGLVGAELPARRMMQVEVDERPLEGVLLTLLAAVTPHQFVERQVAARDQDHGVDGQQKGLPPVAAAADHHVALLLPALWGTRVSSGTVSKLNQTVYKHIEAWRNRSIEGEFPYVYLDGVVLKRSWAVEVRNVSVHADT